MVTDSVRQCSRNMDTFWLTDADIASVSSTWPAFKRIPFPVYAAISVVWLGVENG